jgi:hypothetical protein
MACCAVLCTVMSVERQRQLYGRALCSEQKKRDTGQNIFSLKTIQNQTLSLESTTLFTCNIACTYLHY